MRFSSIEWPWRSAAPYAMAAVSGLWQVFVFPPFSWWWLAPVCVAPLLLAATQLPSFRQRFVAGWLAGAIYWGGACYWVYGVMHQYADLHAAAAGAIFVGFFLAKGLHLALFTAVAGTLARSAWALPLLAAWWVAVEGSHQYLAFTWLHLGNAGAGMAMLARLAPYTGVYGLSFAFLMMNAAVALLVLRRPRWQLAPLFVLLLLPLLPALPAGQTGEVRVRMVQPNVHPDVLRDGRWTTRDAVEHMRQMERLSTSAVEGVEDDPPELLVWPEYPVPAYFFDDPSSHAFMKRVARASEAYFIFNTIAFTNSEPRQPLNSAVALSPEGELLSHYSKMHLVPFGEFVPWPFSLFIDKITLEAGDFAPGERVEIAEAGGHKLGTFICYEVVFARAVREFTARGAEVLVNISNDSWYGRTAARYQHLLIARMRAIENARWLLRATNDGITTILNPAGQLVSSLPSYRQGVLSGKFSYSTKMTWFVRFGQWFWWLSLAVSAAAIWRGGARPESGNRPSGGEPRTPAPGSEPQRFER